MTLQGWCREFLAAETSDDTMVAFDEVKTELQFFDSAEQFLKTSAKRKRDRDTDNPAAMHG